MLVVLRLFDSLQEQVVFPLIEGFIMIQRRELNIFTELTAHQRRLLIKGPFIDGAVFPIKRHPQGLPRHLAFL